MKSEIICYEEDVDIRMDPPLDPSPDMTDVSIGDLHSNPLLLLQILKRHGVIELPTEHFDSFAKLYTLPLLQPTLNKHRHPAPICYDTDKKVTFEKVNTLFNKMLSYIKVIDKTKLIRLIGDDLVDRGVYDYFILKLYEALQAKGANFEILLSNHGVEFVEACERFKANGNKLIAPRLKTHDVANSFNALKVAIDAGAVTNQEVLDLYEKVYKKHLKLLSYSLDAEANEIQVFSHAGIGLNHIKGLAAKFSLPYLASSATDLAKTIDAINAKFTEKVNAGEVHTLYTDEMMQKGFDDKPLDDKEEVVAATLWGRTYDNLIREAKEFKVKFIHGHDSRDDPNLGHITLNEGLGQFDDYKGLLAFYVTNGKHKVPVVTEPLNQNKEPNLHITIAPPPDVEIHLFSPSSSRSSSGSSSCSSPSASSESGSASPQAVAPAVSPKQPAVSPVRQTFFNHTNPFPETYTELWEYTETTSNIDKVKMLLKDYTKEDFIFGSLLGRIVTGHWNRNHVDQVHEIANRDYDSVEALIQDLKQLNPRKGGSLDRRINFIEMQIQESVAGNALN